MAVHNNLDTVANRLYPHGPVILQFNMQTTYLTKAVNRLKTVKKIEVLMSKRKKMRSIIKYSLIVQHT